MQVSRLSPSRKLATVGDTLYMLDSRNRILWKWASDGPPFTDTPIIDSEGTIHVIGYDLLWAAIDSATGHEKWRSTANGRATFWQIELYQRDFYLVVTNMSGYRESSGDNTIEDSVSLCRGNDVLWKADIPAKAHLKVSGDRVFVVYRRHQRTVRWPLHIPRRPLEPIGLVDGRLWSAQPS
ncbi:MAG: hypothetical protein QOE77_18 [Blastocatellia bacterium]|jgi:outer membrane protein assembly factor BamB|nr:hypothetical protein [Blastocatellia bacterium]